jgi:hypothetical protein
MSMPRRAGVVAAFATIATLVLAAAASAAGGADGPGRGGSEHVSQHAKVKTPNGKRWEGLDAAPTGTAVTAAATGTTPVGTIRAWPAVNYVTNAPFLTNFTLRGVGDHVEVWVQNNQTFPAGDCRNADPNRLLITQPQVDYFVHEFDTNIYPTESDVFSVPPSHDGTNSTLALPVFGDPAYYSGDGNRIVTLVMNIRDTNYFDTNNAHGLSYIVGVHHGIVSDYADRNIMTIDSYDWLHRTGATPPNEPVAGNPCTSAPARPFLIESTFAHEYQHLLERWASPGEDTWVNEGLSDFAMELTGYAQPWARPGTPRAESHIVCFEGFQGSTIAGVPFGGPENSLTIWNDQGAAENLCDYGAAWSFMEFLAGRYGTAFMGALHNEDLNGLAGLQATLDRFVTGRRAADVIHEWAAMMALDHALDGTSLRGAAREAVYTSDKLDSSLNWDTTEAYSSPGAPPDGSDYVRLRDASGTYLRARDVQSISFAGATALAPDPIEWTVDGGTLYSGSGDLLDRAIVRQVAVGAGALSFRTRWNAEEQWDFGFVQVSTDGGATYTSVVCDDSRSDVVPEGHPTVKANLPGFTGVSDWKTETCNLSAYAGKTVTLAFRYVTDWGTAGNAGAPFAPGWWIDDVVLDGAGLADGTSLAGWKSFTEQRPTPVAGWMVQLVGYPSDGRTPAVIGTLPLGATFAGTLDRGTLERLLGDQVDVVAAIVTYDDPTGAERKYARYELRVNGVLQPGG